MRGSIFIFMVILNLGVLVHLLFMAPASRPLWPEHFARIHQEIRDYHQDKDQMRADIRVDVIELFTQRIEEEVKWRTSDLNTMNVTLLIIALFNLGVYGLDVFLRQRRRKSERTGPME